MPEGRYLIGLDVGTTAVKGALFDTAGRLVALHSLTYPTHGLGDGRVEQSPDDWMGALDTIVERLLSGIAATDIAALGLCSQVNTHVFVDRLGEPLLPAITWQDSRAADEAADLNAKLEPKKGEPWWEPRLAISASSIVSRMGWVARHHPEIWDNTRWVLSPKDYCLLRLTGVAAADPITSFELVDIDGNYIPDLMALVDGAADRLPPLTRFDHVLGTVIRGPLAAARVPVVTGSMDAWSALYGAGISAVGEGAYTSGTSEILALVSDRRLDAPGTITFLPVDGWNVHAGPTQSGGDALRWFAAATQNPIEDILVLAASANRAASHVLFLPHLYGERAPLWDPHCRAVFAGIGGDTALPELSLAVLEGVAYSARLLFQALLAGAGRPYQSLFLGGNGSRSDLWCQIRADVLGVELKRLAFLDVGVLGAAIMAGTGVGLYASLGEAARHMVKVGTVFTPEPGRKSRYDEMFQIYQDTYQALKATGLRLSRL